MEPQPSGWMGVGLGPPGSPSSTDGAPSLPHASTRGFSEQPLGLGGASLRSGVGQSPGKVSDLASCSPHEAGQDLGQRQAGKSLPKTCRLSHVLPQQQQSLRIDPVGPMGSVRPGLSSEQDTGVSLLVPDPPIPARLCIACPSPLFPQARPGAWGSRGGAGRIRVGSRCERAPGQPAGCWGEEPSRVPAPTTGCPAAEGSPGAHRGGENNQEATGRRCPRLDGPSRDRAWSS